MQFFRQKCATYRLLVAAILLPGIAVWVLTACQQPASAIAAKDEPTQMARACGDGGYLRATLYGAISTQLEWDAADLACEGMPRPDGAGARLRFAGSAGERQLAIIIALPTLQRGTTGDELASNVTLIEEGNGRFFSTSDLNNCWTDVTQIEALDESVQQYAIGGTLYCVQPLAEVNGSSSVSLTEIAFRGLLDWGTT